MIAPPVNARGRAFHTAKDLAMAADCDYGLMIWDCKSPGTLGNVLELLGRQKKSVVYLKPLEQFQTVQSPADLEWLVAQMDDPARQEADRKIALSKKIARLTSRTATTCRRRSRPTARRSPTTSSASRCFRRSWTRCLRPAICSRSKGMPPGFTSVGEPGGDALQASLTAAAACRSSSASTKRSPNWSRYWRCSRHSWGASTSTCTNSPSM